MIVKTIWDLKFQKSKKKNLRVYTCVWCTNDLGIHSAHTHYLFLCLNL